MNTARIFSDVSADRARWLTGRIGDVIQAVRCDRAGKLRVDQSRLHARHSIFSINIENLSQAREFDNDASIDRQRTAGKSRARAARREADSLFIKRSENL